MACCSIIYDIEPQTNQLVKYAGDFDTDFEDEVISMNIELLAEILETFHQDKLRVSELL